MMANPFLAEYCTKAQASNTEHPFMSPENGSIEVTLILLNSSVNVISTAQNLQNLFMLHKMNLNTSLFTLVQSVLKHVKLP